VAGILQHHPHLTVEVVVQIALQIGYGRAAQAGHNGLRMTGIHMVIKSFLGVNADQRPRRARPHAPGTADEHMLVRCPGGLFQGIPQAVRAWLMQARSMQTFTSKSYFSFSWQTLFATCSSSSIVIPQPPFELLDHLFSSHLTHYFAVAQHHGRAAAGTHAASSHQTDLAILGGLPTDNPQALFSRGHQLVRALDITGRSRADGRRVLAWRLQAEVVVKVTTP